VLLGTTAAEHAKKDLLRAPSSPLARPRETSSSDGTQRRRCRRPEQAIYSCHPDDHYYSSTKQIRRVALSGQCSRSPPTPRDHLCCRFQAHHAAATMCRTADALPHPKPAIRPAGAPTPSVGTNTRHSAMIANPRPTPGPPVKPPPATVGRTPAEGMSPLVNIPGPRQCPPRSAPTTPPWRRPVTGTDARTTIRVPHENHRGHSRIPTARRAGEQHPPAAEAPPWPARDQPDTAAELSPKTRAG